MLSVNDKEVLWVEKYRPVSLESCILPSALRKEFEAIIKDGHIPNMIFSGLHGVGKTTVAKAMCYALDKDWIIINASESSGIDTLRNEIRDFASSSSLSGGGKVVILDEADYLQKNSTQPAMRNFLEEFSAVCSFIFTCNKPHRIIPELHSRCRHIVFRIPEEERVSMCKSTFGMCARILKLEGVDYDAECLAKVVQFFYPDTRKTINELQGIARLNGCIDEGAITLLQRNDYGELIGYIKAKDVKAIRKWVIENKDNDTSDIYESLMYSLENVTTVQSWHEAVLVLNEEQRYEGLVPSKELHLYATIITIMGTLRFVK